MNKFLCLLICVALSGFAVAGGVTRNTKPAAAAKAMQKNTSLDMSDAEGVDAHDAADEDSMEDASDDDGEDFDGDGDDDGGDMDDDGGDDGSDDGGGDEGG